MLFKKLYFFVVVCCTALCSLTVFTGDVATSAASRKHDSARSSQPIKAAEAAPDSAGKSGSSTRKRARPHMSLSQRRERHNSKERERRWAATTNSWRCLCTLCNLWHGEIWTYFLNQDLMFFFLGYSHSHIQYIHSPDTLLTTPVQLFVNANDQTKHQKGVEGWFKWLWTLHGY